jgi:hypothetical protein
MSSAASLRLEFDSQVGIEPAVLKKRPPPKPKSLQSELGQFMTPPSIAKFMAGLFQAPMRDEVRLLDPGAGRGALTSAFVAKWAPEVPHGIRADAYEIDGEVAPSLRENLQALNSENRVTTQLIPGDFIENAATMLRLERGPRYTHSILNPPYKKINSGSRHRELLRSAGLETVNLYTGFVALAFDLLEPGGELVAIIPRSFCNGPYYKPFRAFIMKRGAIRHMHLFESRNKAFKEDAVLQENVIIHLQLAVPQADVTISTSTDDTFDDYSSRTYPFAEIVFSDDPESFIHIPTEELSEEFEGVGNFGFSLQDIGVNISTGPVVDFRLRDWLSPMPKKGTVPLLYSGHFSAAGVNWPIPEMKKPNAIARNAETEKWLYPNGFYAVVRRFSSKEEKRRIVASLVDPASLPGEVLGFENHLNVFHQGRHPLPENIARGLAVFLNSTAVDKYFRRFNGHTQVNATDLKRMKYPDREALSKLGVWAKANPEPSQELIDQTVRAMA